MQCCKKLGVIETALVVRPFVAMLVPGMLLLALPCPAPAAGPRVLAEGERPDDARLGDLKELSDYFPFTPRETPEDWAERSEWVRRQMLVALGLWPMPTRCELSAVLHGPVDRSEYTVEKVYFESCPGHFVTGNLYRPKGETGRRPGVLCPHGHWPNGRFHDHGEKKVREQIEKGGERFEVGGRHPIQARCVQLARMGCVVFHYDMVGYADSVQLAHRPGVREEMNTAENWGFFSPQAELRMQTIMGLQAFNSIRALDFLSSLPDVDRKRIGVTGASGGGTQTFILAAIDPRPAVAFPAVMVSTAMQGGCTCENASYLRIGTGNVEFAALFGPRPLGLSAADDWTKEMSTKGFPELQQHYAMLGAADRVTLHSRTEFKHNYNAPSRAAMYRWFNKHLGLGIEEPIAERDYEPLSVEEMKVWNDGHSQPPGGAAHERALLRWMTEDAEKKLAALEPKDAAAFEEFRRVVGGAVDVMIGRKLPSADAITADVRTIEPSDDHTRIGVLLKHRAAGEEVPIVRLQPKSGGAKVVLWLSPDGKRALFDADGRPRAAVAQLLKAGTSVVGIDLFGQGEFTKDGEPIGQARLVRRDKQGRPGYAGYTFGYNYPLFSKRVHDVLTAVAYLSDKRRQPVVDEVCLLGLAGAGHWAAAARAQAGGAVDRAAIDTAGFRFADVTAIDDPDFLPGIVKYGDLPTLLALSAPHRLWVAGEGSGARGLVRTVYGAAKAEESLSTRNEPHAKVEEAAIRWFVE